MGIIYFPVLNIVVIFLISLFYTLQQLSAGELVSFILILCFQMSSSSFIVQLYRIPLKFDLSAKLYDYA